MIIFICNVFVCHIREETIFWQKGLWDPMNRRKIKMPEIRND